MGEVRFVTVEKMAELTGYTPKAIERKIEGGVWLHGKVWRKAPDGRRLMDVEGYNAWVVDGTLGSSLKVNRASKSLSNIVGSGAGRQSNSSLRPPT